MAQPSEQLAERVIVRLPREDRIRDILAAAKDVFCRRGFVDASIGEIATQAGVAQGTIYKFFDSKRDLVLAVLRDWYESMVATFKADLPAIHGTQNKLRFIVRRHLQSLMDNPDLCRLCANEVRNSGDNYQSEIFDLNR
jgi:AcrR family transcriptional regulator